MVKLNPYATVVKKIGRAQSAGKVSKKAKVKRTAAQKDASKAFFKNMSA